MKDNKTNIGIVMAGLIIGLLLASFDQTIISTAMPSIVKDLGGLSLYSWAFTAYMLASTTSMPIFGKLSDLYGRRRVYLFGMFLFLAGSILCGLASTMTELIIYRVVQGIGGGALIPLAMAIAGDILPAERKGRILGIFSGIFGLSSIFGPALGGMIVEHWDWSWIFYINVPFGLAAFMLIIIGLKENNVGQKHAIDWWGALTLSGAIVSILLAFVLAGDEHASGTHYAWGSPQIIGLFCLGAVLLGLFIWIEAKVKEPILSLGLFRNRTITLSLIIGFLMNAGLFGAVTYIPLFVQGVIGISPSVAGYILTPLMLAVMVTSIIGGRLLHKVSPRMIVVCSMAIMAVGFYFMSQMGIDTTRWQLVIYMLITGAGMGPLLPLITLSVQNSASPSQIGVATSSVQFFRNLGSTIGVSVLGGIMAQRMASGVTDLIAANHSETAAGSSEWSNPQLLLDAKARASLSSDTLLGLKQVMTNSIDLIFFTAFFILLAGVLLGFFLNKTSAAKAKEA